MKRFSLAMLAVLLPAAIASAQTGPYAPYPQAAPYAMPDPSQYTDAYGNPVSPEQLGMQGMAPGGNCDPAMGGYGAGGAGAYPGFEGARGGLDLGWFIDTEAIFLKRSRAEERELIVDAFTGDEVVDTGDASFNFEPGLLIRGGVFTDCGPGIETVYYGIHDWHGSEDAIELNQLNLAGDIGLTTFDFFGADRVRVDYDAQLDNFELNVIQPYGHLWIITGFRYMELSEEFNINSFDSDTGRSDFSVETDNFLWGAQVGFRAEYEFYAVGVEVIGKVALFDNAGYQRNILRDFNNIILIRDADSVGAQLASAGELGISATMPLTEVFTLRAGYNILVIGGLALAPEQLDLNADVDAGTSLNQDGEILAHGMNIGIEGRW